MFRKEESLKKRREKYEGQSVRIRQRVQAIKDKEECDEDADRGTEDRKKKRK